MLKIWVGRQPDTLFTVKESFNSNKDRTWFNNDFVKQVIKDIDNSIAVKDEYIESPVFGAISPDRLSGGCKAVILLYIYDNINVYGTRCGDNCVPSILKLAEMKDITITLCHPMRFPDKFEALILNNNKMVYSFMEFVEEFYDLY